MENNLQRKKNRPGWWLLTLTLLLLALVPAKAQDFTEITPTNLTGISSSSVAWGDYDNDGDLDIVMIGKDYLSGSDVSKVYTNNGTGFTAVPDGIPIGVSNGSVSWADYDNDGLLDILLTGTDVSLVYRNTGSGFAMVEGGLGLLRGTSYGSAAWGDYDNDGDFDIFLTGSTSSGRIAKLYRNTGTSFAEVTEIVFSGVDNSSSAWGDYNNDGLLDILMIGYNGSSGVSKLYRNTGTGFAEVSSAGLLGVFNGSVAWGDYDNDGDLDILMTGINGSTKTCKLYQNTAGNFTEVTSTGLIGVSNGSAVWGDYDNDGDLDILLTGLASSGFRVSKVYQNTGTSFIEVMGLNLQSLSNSSVAWGDYDNDKDLDILLTGTDGFGHYSKLYRNNISTANTLPVAPAVASLASVVTGSTVKLTWDKATDAETPQDGLTYNLRIGTTLGGSEVLSAMAVAAGARKLPVMGNVNHYPAVGEYEVKDLAPGTYYWSVQAVDGAFAGSAFATEQQFEVSTTTGIADEQVSKLLLYPNPAESVLYVELAEDATLAVVSVLGQVLLQQQAKAGQTVVDVSQLSSGTYLLQVTTAKAISTKRFVKK